jgi:hypothetical protein
MIARNTGAQSSLKVDTKQSGIGSFHHSPPPDDRSTVSRSLQRF